MFNLRFDAKEIQYWADKYDYPQEPSIADCIVPRVKFSGYLTREDFLTICDWKTSRSRKHVEKNPEDFVEEVTQVALSAKSERLRIEILTLLSGVSWPTASVILHFCHNEPYPILDFRALWSLGVDAEPNDYEFDLWWQYTVFCRRLADENLVSMRTLDKALWQYSKENQETASNPGAHVTPMIVSDGITMIKLPYGGKDVAFPVDSLVQYIRSSGRPFIIQGGAKVTFDQHTKPHSLDYWLRKNHTVRKDTQQAVNEVTDALVATGRFKIDNELVCPDSGRMCKGLTLVEPLKGS